MRRSAQSIAFCKVIYLHNSAVGIIIQSVAQIFPRLDGSNDFIDVGARFPKLSNREAPFSKLFDCVPMIWAYLFAIILIAYTLEATFGYFTRIVRFNSS